MDFRVEKKDSFCVVGYSIQTTNQKGEGRTAAPALWSRVQKEGLDKKLLNASNQDPKGLFGLSIYNTDREDSRKFHYMVAVSSDCETLAECTTYAVPARTWAIFPCTKETIGKTEVMAITKWIPKSKYKALNKGYLTGRMKSGAPDMEHYGIDGSAEIWVAVEEKGK